MARFLCTVSYEEKGHEVLVEVWLENGKPDGQTEREEVENALRQIAASGVAPEGWTVSAVNWSHPRSGKSGMDSAKLEAFDAIVRSSSEIGVEENPKRPPQEKDEEGR